MCIPATTYFFTSYVPYGRERLQARSQTQDTASSSFAAALRCHKCPIRYGRSRRRRTSHIRSVRTYTFASEVSNTRHRKTAVVIGLRVQVVGLHGADAARDDGSPAHASAHPTGRLCLQEEAQMLPEQQALGYLRLIVKCLSSQQLLPCRQAVCQRRGEQRTVTAAAVMLGTTASHLETGSRWKQVLSK